MGASGQENSCLLKPVSQTDSSITYGPYTNIEAVSENEMVIHSENNNPMLVVTRLQRVILHVGKHCGGGDDRRQARRSRT